MKFLSLNLLPALLILSLVTSYSNAASADQDLLIKMRPEAAKSFAVQTLFNKQLNDSTAKIESVDHGQWFRVQTQTADRAKTLLALRNNSQVLYAQPNFKLGLMNRYQIKSPKLLKWMKDQAQIQEFIPGTPKADNPNFVTPTAERSGADPDFSKQWGMNDIGVKQAWQTTMGSPDVIVAVIDTGVDYTHEDLVNSMWINTKEIPNNGIDDDHNGFVDDIVGWDFASNDNKPFDLTSPIWDMLSHGGNPGHGTHCAGNIAARADNSMGIAGVAPHVKVMALRFISDKGQGTTADAVKAIRYAVDNGARVLSNSWGSEGDDGDTAENQALKDAITYAMNKNVLFVAAAGNGHSGVGYDNDTDAKPGIPASYTMDNIVSVAAVNSSDALGAFSNWGLKTVHIAAPGVKVYSSTSDGKYNDMVIDYLGVQAAWDGTSMATPHVAGAAALYWSAHPEASYKQVKNALITSAKKIPALANKCVSGGKLDVAELMKH